MDSLLEFAKGPLFRLTFALMVLGLIRIFYLDIQGAWKAYRKTDDKKMPWKLIIIRTFEWFFPAKRLKGNFRFFSIFSILFHIGLILVPIFLFAHIQLWENSVGISWIALPYSAALWLTISTIVFGAALFITRLVNRTARALSRKQDYLWLILLLIPFVTGFICANLNIAPSYYRFFMLIHILAGELIFVLIPFSKIAHCVLAPLSQIISTLAWKFPPETDDKVSTTLNKKGAPV
jgi:nitrate reductase gamma subunit